MMNKTHTNENSMAIRSSLSDTLAGAVLFCFAPLTILAMYLMITLAH